VARKTRSTAIDAFVCSDDGIKDRKAGDATRVLIEEFEEINDFKEFKDCSLFSLYSLNSLNSFTSDR
jgi:hypothetical protein